MSGLFFSIDFNEDISNWDVTNMIGMFVFCTNFNQNLNNWNTYNVRDMTHMFYGCRNLYKRFYLNIENVDTPTLQNGKIEFEDSHVEIYRR